MKTSRLVPRRPLAQAMCENGSVTVNGVKAKSSRAVKAGDVITIKKGSSIRTALVKQVPEKKQLSAAQASETFELLASEREDPLDALT